MSAERCGEFVSSHECTGPVDHTRFSAPTTRPNTIRWVTSARHADNDYRAIALDADGQTRDMAGHACYSRDGQLLFTAENDLETARGIIGVHEVNAGYRRVAEFDTYGIGPHELIRPEGSDWLVIANGGIRTHPDHGDGRDPLNLDGMAPSIVVLDARDGRLISRHALSDERHRVSLRHLAHDGDGRIWFAAQLAMAETDDGPETVTAHASPLPLAGWFDLADRATRWRSTSNVSTLWVLELPDDRVPQRHAYLSSVAARGSSVVYTAARDGVAFRVDARRQLASGSIAPRLGQPPAGRWLPMTIRNVGNWLYLPEHPDGRSTVTRLTAIKPGSMQQDLKSAGLKLTLPRQSILEILEKADPHHLSAEDVYRALIEKGTDVGLATVYRVLTQFESAGLVTRHHFDGGQAVFELDTGDNHDHIVCVKSGVVAEFSDEVINQRLSEIAAELGYELHEHKIVLYGEHKKSVSAAGRRRRKR